MCTKYIAALGTIWRNWRGHNFCRRYTLSIPRASLASTLRRAATSTILGTQMSTLSLMQDEYGPQNPPGGSSIRGLDGDGDVAMKPEKAPPPLPVASPSESQRTSSSEGSPAYRTRLMLSGHSRSISSIKFSADGKMLASAGASLHVPAFLVPELILLVRKQAADKTVKLWDTETGEILNTLEGHTEGISDIAWSPDGEFLASASDDKTIRLWSLEMVGFSSPFTMP